MSKVLVGITSAVIGAAIGATVTYVAVSRKFAKADNEEVDSLMNIVKKQADTIKEMKKELDEVTADTNDKAEEKTKEAVNYMRMKDLEDGSGKLIPIDVDAYGTLMDYEDRTATLYQNGRMVDDEDKDIELDFDKSKLDDNGVAFFRDPINKVDWQIVSVKMDR